MLLINLIAKIYVLFLTEIIDFIKNISNSIKKGNIETLDGKVLEHIMGFMTSQLDKEKGSG